MKNKVIIITGAGMGLGYAAAKELASRGSNLVLVDYNEKALEDGKTELTAEFPELKVVTVTADVSDEAKVKKYVDETVKAFGRIDGLYNNAGIEGKQASITEYDVNVFKKVIDINLMGVYYGLRYVIPVMQKQHHGRIVNVASVGGIRPMVSEAFKQVNPEDPKAAETEYAQRNPTKRLGLPHEVAKLVAFLLSEENGYVNGQTIAIDGGESNIYGNS